MEYAMETAKKYAVESMSNKYHKDNYAKREHMPYGMVSESSERYAYERERPIIERPVAYESMDGEEIVRPVHHHHHENQPYYEPERRVEYVEYERASEYDREGYGRHGRESGCY